MAYYLITSDQYNEIESTLSHGPAWTLDRRKCVVHLLETQVPSEFEMSWETPNECNEWRFADPEWRNWMTEEEHSGE